jgi:peptidase M28-like protein
MRGWRQSRLAVAAACATFFVAACGHSVAPSSGASSASASADSNSAAGPAMAAATSAAQVSVAPADQAPPASQTGGFDGAKAYDFTAKLVAFGPRPPASDAIHKMQDYIIGQLKSFGCAVDTDDFHSQTPIGDMAMKNIIAKVSGSGQGIILLLTHYDTLRLDGFVGAEDGGSSTGLMLEMARNLCGSAAKQPNSVWMAFLDGEEAQVVTNGEAQWTATDSVYGSRELSASLAVSGDLKRVRAVILADMVGQKDLSIPREEDSTKWLVDLVWSTAARLGYQSTFSDLSNSIDDDHMPFLHRGVPSVDIIDLYGYQQPGYWHTTKDTLDKISPRNLAIVGHVIIESVAELQTKFK